MVRMSIGECSFDMAEQLAFEKGFGNGSCIDADHRTQTSFRKAVYLIGKYIFSCSVLAGYQDGRIGRSNLLHSLADCRHGLSMAPHHLFFRRLFLSDASGRIQTMPVGVFERLYKLVILPRLDYEVKCSALHSFYGQLDVGISREQHDLDVLAALLDLAEPVKPFVAGIYVSMEIHVEKDDVGLEISNPADKFHRRRYDLHLSEMHRQEQLERRPDSAVVVNDKYLSLAFCHL